jgi:hypothetical protein
MKIKTAKEFIEKAKSIDNGRFSNIIDAVSINDTCFKCYFFAPDINNPGHGYRCRCIGSCPAATIKSDVWNYIFRKIDETNWED